MFGLYSSAAAVAQNTTLAYSDNPDFIVIEYSVAAEMIAQIDTIPLLRIYGNGQVVVHFPSYTQRAGDYTMQIGAAELQELLYILENNGVMRFDRQKVLQQKRQSLLQQRATRNLVTQRSDDTRTTIKINLSSYQSGSMPIATNNFQHILVWKNLKEDAREHPDIGALTAAASAEQRLSVYLTHPDLVRIP